MLSISMNGRQILARRCTSANQAAIIHAGFALLMSDPLRTDGTRMHDVESAQDRDAKIEQLLLLGLDHYFAARYELAINVWTRALFLDRSHARARAYIERARSALAERQRESEELLQNGVAAFHRGESDEARRLLQAALDAGAPAEEALAVLERLNRLEPAMQASATPAPAATARRRAPLAAASARSFGGMIAALLLALVAFGVGGYAAWSRRVDWRSLVALVTNLGSVEPPSARAALPVARETMLALPRRGEETLVRAKGLAAGGHLHEALAFLEDVRPTDPQKAEADRLRADIQRQLLALSSAAAAPPDGEKGERRNP
jgi:tetratricopeptide (TPR) repeat protein